MKNSNHNLVIDEALADLRLQERPNILATAIKYQLVESTLRRRWQRKTVSIEEASSEWRQRLTNAQEDQLVLQINRLTDRGIPPTAQIMRNLAEEIIGGSVGKNWTGDFVRRYKDRITSLYLRNIDSQRIQSEYTPLFKYFYDLVTFNWSIWSRFTNNFLVNCRHGEIQYHCRQYI